MDTWDTAEMAVILRAARTTTQEDVDHLAAVRDKDDWTPSERNAFVEVRAA